MVNKYSGCVQVEETKANVHVGINVFETKQINFIDWNTAGKDGKINNSVLGFRNNWRTLPINRVV